MNWRRKDQEKEEEWWELEKLLSKPKIIEQDEDDETNIHQQDALDFINYSQTHATNLLNSAVRIRVKARFSWKGFKKTIKGEFYVISPAFQYKFDRLFTRGKSYSTFNTEKLEYRKKKWNQGLLLRMVSNKNRPVVSSWSMFFGRRVTEKDVLEATNQIPVLKELVESNAGKRYFYYDNLARIENYYNKKCREFVLSNMSITEMLWLDHVLLSGDGVEKLCFNITKNLYTNMSGLPELSYEGFKLSKPNADPIIDNAVSIYHEILKIDVYGHNMNDVCNPKKRATLLYIPEYSGHMYSEYGTLIHHCRNKDVYGDSIKWLIQEGIVHQPPVAPEDIHDLNKAIHIYIADMWETQQRIANIVIAISERWKNEGKEKGMTHRAGGYSKRSTRKLNKLQKQAVKNVINNSVSVITGMGGTGKTEAVKDVVDLYGNDDPECCTVLFVGPTGRSAVNATERVKQAYTIDKVICTLRRAKKLKMQGKLQLKSETLLNAEEDDPEWYLAASLKERRNKEISKKETLFRTQVRIWINMEVLIIDETSMVDTKKFELLLRYLNMFCDNFKKIVIVGDARQLQSIQAGRIMLDIMEAFPEAVTELTENMRNPSSTIFKNANSCMKQCTNLLYDTTFKLIRATENSDISSTIMNLLHKLVMKQGINKYNIHFVTFLNKNADKINAACRCFYTSEYEPRNGRFKVPEFFVGEKIYFKKNNYSFGVMNGEIWIIKRYIDVMKVGAHNYDVKSNIEQPKGILRRRVAEIQNEDGSRILHIDLEGLPFTFENVSLGYATTINKYQGTQNRVVVYYNPKTNRYENTSHFYTAITRSTELMLLLSNRETIIDTLQKIAPKRRSTLAKYIKEGFAKKKKRAKEGSIEKLKKRHVKEDSTEESKKKRIKIE